ncbi:MAG TPA: M20/M25/M40 family metallo-hydrolase, partial [Kofleriaceae bacterium]|nr:M20/M25/M40 family metallo-hydrolase [Kofleriaceae bacterium]
ACRHPVTSRMRRSPPPLARRAGVAGLALAVATQVACRSSAPVPRRVPAAAELVTDDELLRHLRPEPWLDSPGTSEQYFPIFVGASVRHLVLGRPPAARPQLPVALRELGLAQARRIAETLPGRHVDLELWPTQDWNGQPNWVFARWRPSGDATWTWLTETGNWRSSWSQVTGEKPLLPELFDPSKPPGRDELFGDFLASSDLYFQPRFGNCVYVRASSGAIAAAWPDPREREARAAELTRPGAFDAYCVNQPARFNDRPAAFVVPVDAGAVTWPAEIDWVPAPSERPAPAQVALQVPRWPSDFAIRYEEDLRIADGELEAHYPLSGGTARFRNKGSFQPDHDLERMVDYLEERYRVLSIETVRQRFTWRGIPQSNLIAIIRGTEPGPPAVMADHIDAACEEDTFARTGRRVTTHGADDNATATAALLGAAAVLRDAHPRHDIWLVHLTGEELPSDDLGARHFLSEMMRAGQDIRAAVIADFIGWHPPGPPRFQVSPTSLPGSERMAALALDAARQLAPELAALYAARTRLRNSVFQTDLQEFEFYGVPGILFNEDLDYSDRKTLSPYNHQSTDVVAHLDLPFAVAVARVAIETTLRLAND